MKSKGSFSRRTAAATALALGLGLFGSTGDARATGGLVGVWKATKQVVRGKPVKKQQDVTWEFRKGGAFVSTTTIPKRYPFKRQGTWKIGKDGKLLITLAGRARTFKHRLKGRASLKLIERIGDNKTPRIYRLTRLAAAAKKGK